MPSRSDRSIPSPGASPWRLACIGAVLVWLPEAFLPWDWRGPAGRPLELAGDLAFFLGGYAILGRLMLWASDRLDRQGAPGRGASPSPLAAALRVARQGVAMLAVVEAAYALLYLAVLPGVRGIHMPAAATWRWGLHVGVVALVLQGWRSAGRAARERASSLQRLEAEADALHQALAGAELALLERQVEPHFLFNTLAHVRRALRHAPDEGRGMLTALADYLSRAGPSVRRQDWTLGDELDLVETWLGLVRQRFGPRLRVAIDAPSPLRQAPLPALAIATLVENAVQHGLAPRPEGGCIHIGVESGAMLHITVSDDGVGLRAGQGGGLGLATVRARLRAAFGAGAALTLQATAGQPGVRATVRIPLHV